VQELERDGCPLVAPVGLQNVRADVEIVGTWLGQDVIELAHRIVSLLWPQKREGLPLPVAVLAFLIDVCATTDGEMGIAFGITYCFEKRAVKAHGDPPSQ